MADDGERRPAENPRFPQFLKRGEGSKKYNKINYMRPKSSTGSQIRPSATSESSDYPSTSAYVDVNTHTASKIPSLQLSPPIVVPDSGRGSAAPHEQIYAMPSNRSVESGYGGYNESLVPSPDRSGEEIPDADTLVNDYSHDPSHHVQEQTNRTTDDEVFLPNDNNNNAYRSPALESFVRHEQAIERQMDENTEMSTPTRELRIRAASRELDNYYASDSSVGHHRMVDQESVNTNDGPLSSTPIHAIPFEHVEQPVVLPLQPAPRHVRSVGTSPKETPILGEMTSSEPHSELSSPTTVEPTFKASSDESSLSSTRKLIANMDRPLKEAFPERNHVVEPRTPAPRPSQSTQYQARHAALQPSLLSEDHLRRAALNNQRSRRQAAAPSTASSEDVHTTPLRKLIPKTTDPVVKILRRQLRDNVAHVDLGCSNLHDGFKKLAKLRQMYVEKEAQLDYALQQAEKEREEANSHVHKELDSLRKDRLNLERREKEFQKLQAEKDKENKDQLVTAGAQVATQRHIVRCKDKQIADLKAELEAKDDMKARLEKTLEMQKNNHLREIKKYQNEIADLQKRLSLAETTATKKRVGLQPRNSSGPPQHNQYDHSLPLPEPDREPVLESHQRAQSFNYDQPPDLGRKQVQFDLGKNVVYNHFSQPDMSNYYKFSPLTPMTIGTVGTCHPFRNKDKNEITYLYNLKHEDGHECGAKIFKYPTNDAKWIYGPIEIYLCHRFPLVINIRCIDVEIRVFSKTTEIHRENMEVSSLDHESELVTEVMRRKDRSGYYAALFSARTKALTSIYGSSDNPAEEDQIALRRGVLSDKREYLHLGAGKQGYEVHWINEKIPSAQVKQYRVISVGIGMTKITVGLQTETIDITACPEKDWIIIRHDVNGAKSACCDLGKPSRDREREGIFTASGKHVSIS